MISYCENGRSKIKEKKNEERKTIIIEVATNISTIVFPPAAMHGIGKTLHKDTPIALAGL